MHKIFGIKESAEYFDCEGAYLILIHNNRFCEEKEVAYGTYRECK